MLFYMGHNGNGAQRPAFVRNASNDPCFLSLPENATCMYFTAINDNYLRTLNTGCESVKIWISY